MILADANLLLYAYDASSPWHRRARAWLEAALAEAPVFGLSWQTITAFLRISTSPRAYRHPFSPAEAAAIVAGWLEVEPVRILRPGERHWAIFSRFLTDGQARGPLVMDAHLAALAVEHGAVLHTTDLDFSRFPGLKRINPLADEG